MYQPPTLNVMVPLELPRITDESTVGDVLNVLNDAVKRAFGNHEELFGRSWNLKADAKWFDTRGRWMVIFFVEGGSEGHYVHVDTMTGYHSIGMPASTIGTCRHLFMVKTFHGYERAQELQRIAQFILTGGTGA